MRHAACALVAALAGTAHAQLLDVLNHTPPRVYEGQSVVRVRADSIREVNAAMALSESLWSEGAGVNSPFDLQIQADRIGALREAGLEVEIIIPDLQANADRAWAELRQAARFDRPRPLNTPRGGNPHDETWFANYKQLDQIYAYINNLAAARPDLASVSDVGNTIQGRDQFAITITGPDQPGNPASARPVVIWNGCQHAREWVSPMTVTYIASRLVSDYDTDPVVKDLVDSTRFVVLPVTNPDGYLYSWSTERYWRKNRRSTYGVDLNRNWGYEWGGDGSSGATDSDIYRGATPFSEPETQSLRDLALSFGDDLVAHIDYHTYSQLILYPFGYADGVQAPEPDRTFFQNLTEDMSDLIQSQSGAFYNPIVSWLLYPAAGTASDWFYGDPGAKSLTIELRPSDQDVFGLDGFSPPASTILPTAQENWAAAKLFAQRTTLPLAFGLDAPATVAADEQPVIGFTLTPGTQDYDPTSVVVSARVGAGPFVPVPTTPNGTGTYSAALPAPACGQTVEFTVSATTLGGSVLTFPSSGSFAIDAVAIAFTDDMESNTGWTVGAPGDSASTGQWERADPQPTAAQPGDDHTPAGTLCWITGAQSGTGVGSFDVDGGATTLTSPAFDATAGAGDAILSYYRWYSNDQGAAPNSDSMLVQISNNNGSTWSTLETVTENANAWVGKSFRIADFVSPTDQVRVRFVASDLGDGSIVEAGVDDLSLSFTDCESTLTADLAAPFGVFNFFDIAAYIDLYGASDPAADYDQNGTLNFFDIGRFIELYNAGI